MLVMRVTAMCPSHRPRRHVIERTRVNISSFHLGRRQRAGKQWRVIEVDAPVADVTLKETACF